MWYSCQTSVWLTPTSAELEKAQSQLAWSYFCCSVRAASSTWMYYICIIYRNYKMKNILNGNLMLSITIIISPWFLPFHYWRSPIRIATANHHSVPHLLCPGLYVDISSWQSYMALSIRPVQTTNSEVDNNNIISPTWSSGRWCTRPSPALGRWPRTLIHKVLEPHSMCRWMIYLHHAENSIMSFSIVCYFYLHIIPKLCCLPISQVV